EPISRFARFIDVDRSHPVVGGGGPVDQHAGRGLALVESELVDQPSHQRVVLVGCPTLPVEHSGDRHASLLLSTDPPPWTIRRSTLQHGVLSRCASKTNRYNGERASRAA